MPRNALAALALVPLVFASTDVTAQSRELLALPPIAGPPPAAPLETTPGPPVTPMVNHAMRAGRWELQGSKHVWEPPDRTLQPVETRPPVNERWVWDRDEYRWRFQGRP